MKSARPWLSVVIPARNAAQELAGCLESLAACQEPGLEVIVVDDGSQDNTRAVARALGPELGLRLSVLGQTARGAGAARNLGAGRAQGEVIFFTQPAARVPPGLPARLKELFSDPGLSAAAGGLRPLEPDQPLARLSALELAFDAISRGREPDPCPLMTCAAFRASDLKAAGMCDETLVEPGGRDRDLCQRLLAAGGRLVLDPDLWVRLPLPRTWGQVWRSELRRGRQRYQDLRRGRRLGPGAHLQPALVLLAAGLLAALGPHDPGRAVSLALICLLLLYPANRPFLRLVGSQDPGLMRQALALCFLRPLAWTLGMLAAALNRMGGGGGGGSDGGDGSGGAA